MTRRGNIASPGRFRLEDQMARKRKSIIPTVAGPTSYGEDSRDRIAFIILSILLIVAGMVVLFAM
jgi:hypothetical protein